MTKQEESILENDEAQLQEKTDELAAERPESAGRFRTSHRAVWILAALVILCAAGAWPAWRYYAVRESTDDAQIDGYVTLVSARVGGTVLTVNFEDHQQVEAGQTLVQIDPRDYRIQSDHAQAELQDRLHGAAAARTLVPVTSASASSALSGAQAELASAEKQAATADARIREAEANHTRTSLDLGRMKELIVHDEISRQQYDNAVAAEDAAGAALEAARSASAAAHSQVAQAQARVRAALTAPQQVAISQARAGSAEDAVAQARTTVDRASLDLEYTVVKAPVTGVAGGRNVQPGQVVQAGQPLLALVDLSHLWCTVNFKETQLHHMKLGQPAVVHVDAYDADYRGHVEAFGGATGARFSVLPPENATGNYVKVVQRIPVKVAFEPGQDLARLRPGMSVVVTVLTR
jgi:membrane fusion protein (multidrug efflux system)